MGNKIVTFVLPLEEEGSIEISTCKIPSTEKTVYDACGFFEDEIFPKSDFKTEKTKITEHTALRSIINLHDEAGIDIKKIKGMPLNWLKSWNIRQESYRNVSGSMNQNANSET